MPILAQAPFPEAALLFVEGEEVLLPVLEAMEGEEVFNCLPEGKADLNRIIPCAC